MAESEDSKTIPAAQWAEMSASIQRLKERVTDLEEGGQGDDAAAQVIQEASGDLGDLVAHIPDGLFAVGRDWRIQFVNEAASRFLKWPSERLLGANLKELLPEGEQAELIQYVRGVMETGKPRTAVVKVVPLEREDGGPAWYELSICAVPPGIIACVARDITARQRTEDELRAHARRLDATVRELTLSMTMLELCHAQDTSILDLLEQIPVMLPHFFQHSEVACARLSTELTVFKSEPYLETDWKVASPISIFEASGGSLTVYYMEERPPADVGPFTKEEQHLVRSAAARIGALLENAIVEEARAASAAKYGDILAATEVEADETDGEAPTPRPIPLLPSGAGLGRPTEEDRGPAYLRKKTIAHDPLDLSVTVLALAEVLLESCSKDITIETAFEQDLDLIVCDPELIGQIVMNLILNAIEAVGSIATITVETENVTLEEKDLPPKSNMKPGRHVRFTVTDNGLGLNEEQLESAFVPYFTTKGDQGHKGLGLTLVRGVVRRHAGSVHIESKVGETTTVTVLLPSHGSN